MAHNHESSSSLDTNNDNLGLRNRRSRRALAGLLIGGGVLAAGTYVTLEQVLNGNPPSHSVDHEHHTNSTTEPDLTIATDDWPDIPKTPLPRAEILSPAELQDLVNGHK